MPGPWGRAVRRLLADKRMSQASLARRTGLSVNTITAICHGRHTLTSQLQAIADVFAVPLEEVLMVPLSFGPGFAPYPSTESQGGRSHAHGVTFPSSAADEHTNKELWAHIRNLEETLAQYVAQQAVEHGIARERAAAPRPRKRQRPAADRPPRAQTAQRDTAARKRKP